METQIYKVRDPSGALREIRGPVGASDEEVIRQAQVLLGKPETKAPAPEVKPAKPEPSDVSVGINAANKAIAGVPDALLNAPTNLFNLGKAAVGTVATASGRPDLAPELTPTPNFVTRGVKAMGLIRPDAEPVNARQRIIDTAVQGGASALFSPAASLPQAAANITTGLVSGGVGGTVGEVTGNDTLGTAASIVTPMAVNAAAQRGRNAVTKAQETNARNEVRNKSLMDARNEGYVVPPSSVKPGLINTTLESFAGKAATKQDAQLRNQVVTNDIAARELGLPKGTPITEGKLRDFRNKTSAPYREVADLDPEAARSLTKLQDVREQAMLALKEYNGPNHPRQALNDYKALTAEATRLETYIEGIATNAGKPKLVGDLREARKQIAKSYDIERALNLGDASVSAPTLGRALDRGAPLTGGLRTTAAFAEGPGRQVVRDGSGVPTPGVSALNPYGSLALGAAGGAAVGPAGLLAAGVPLLRGPARSLALSPMYQRLMADPNVSPGVLNGILSRGPNTPQDVQALQGLLLGGVLSQQ